MTLDDAQRAVQDGRQRVLEARTPKAELPALRDLVKKYQKLVEAMRR